MIMTLKRYGKRTRNPNTLKEKRFNVYKFGPVLEVRISDLVPAAGQIDIPHVLWEIPTQWPTQATTSSFSISSVRDLLSALKSLLHNSKIIMWGTKPLKKQQVPHIIVYFRVVKEKLAGKRLRNDLQEDVNIHTLS
jgi:hypothetical protein